MTPDTAVDNIVSLTNEFGLVVALVIGSMFFLLAGLYGLGWGKRKVVEHVTGETGFAASEGKRVSETDIVMSKMNL